MREQRSKSDKLRFISFQAFAHDPHTGMVHAYATYDVRKLRRLKYDKLCDLVFEKTLRIYPFAIIDRFSIGWGDVNCKTVQVMVSVPLSKGIYTTVLEGD